MSIAANIRLHRAETQLASLLLEISGLTSRVKLLEDALRSPGGPVTGTTPTLPGSPVEVGSVAAHAASPAPRSAANSAAKSKAGQGFPSRKAKRAAAQAERQDAPRATGRH